MNLDVVLLLLRMITGALLLGFLLVILWVLWHDYRTAADMIADSKRPRGWLVITQSAAAESVTSDHDRIGTSFPLLPLTSLGRAPTNTVVLHDTFCSQEHALLTWRGGQWWLEDRRSSNGTLLNDEPISAPVVVSSGDVIGIGYVRLKVELE